MMWLPSPSITIARPRCAIFRSRYVRRHGTAAAVFLRFYVVRTVFQSSDSDVGAEVRYQENLRNVHREFLGNIPLLDFNWLYCMFLQICKMWHEHEQKFKGLTILLWDHNHVLWTAGTYGTLHCQLVMGSSSFTCSWTVPSHGNYCKKRKLAMQLL